MISPSYVIISPVRDEEAFLFATIESVVAQTISPRRWIIVDDGSSDRSTTIADAAAAKNSWIEVVKRDDRGFRQPGGGVIAAFCQGYERVKDEPWDFLVKLDGDLSFAPDYFEECFRRFARDRKLGIGGGTVCQKIGEKLVPEAPNDPLFHVRGATKIYKRECWNAIGGLMEAPGWDTVDEYKANMLGWSTYTFPGIKLRHHRHAGGAQGTWRNWVKNGLANYVAGYHPLFMTCKCGKRVFTKPYAIGGLGLFVGFVTGYLRGVPQIDDKDLIRYVRQQQLSRLFGRESLWDRKVA